MEDNKQCTDLVSKKFYYGMSMTCTRIRHKLTHKSTKLSYIQIENHAISARTD